MTIAPRSRQTTESEAISHYFDRLWPLLRSITGDGVRRTHEILSEILPLERWEVPTGTPILDWTVPKEWLVRDAYIVTPDGRRILDVWENTLHLVNYAAPFRGRLTRRELDTHLYSLPDLPDAIPYMTSYFHESWGFCIAHRDRLALPEGNYEVVVDTQFIDGAMTLSECVLPGRTNVEVLFSTYTCHPSMANNELSGPLVAAFLYRRLAAIPDRRLTYRFVFLPETIGSIAYLAKRGEHLRSHLAAGYVLSCIGDPGPFTYKRSQRGDTLADRAAIYALRRRAGHRLDIVDFTPVGSDEKNYCSPGYDLPVGALARTLWTRFPQYHTSLDNRAFITFEAMVESVDMCVDVCRVLEANDVYANLMAHGQPFLSKHRLFPPDAHGRNLGKMMPALLWVHNQSDGSRDLLSIAERSEINIEIIGEAATRLMNAGLLRRIDG